MKKSNGASNGSLESNFFGYYVLTGRRGNSSSNFAKVDMAPHQPFEAFDQNDSSDVVIY